jgi:hypothetical protein
MSFSLIISVDSLTEDNFIDLTKKLSVLLAKNNLEDILSIQKIKWEELSSILSKIEKEKFWLETMKNLTNSNVIIVLFVGNIKDSTVRRFMLDNKHLFLQNQYYYTRTFRHYTTLQNIVNNNIK